MCGRQTPAEQLFAQTIKTLNIFHDAVADITENKRGYAVTCIQLIMGSRPDVNTPQKLVDYVALHDDHLPAKELRRVVNEFYHTRPYSHS